MLTACVEPFAGCLEQIKGLIPAHYEELSEHKLCGIALDPNYDLYLARDRMGEVLLIALRDGGNLVGYLTSFVAPGLHYQGCLTALSDIFFVYPDKRGAQGGKLLFQEWERECKRRGVRLMMAGVKVKHAKHARALLEFIGFFEAEIMFWKFLDEAS
jgi:GNAT superfamily N-acetyltransferase